MSKANNEPNRQQETVASSARALSEADKARARFEKMGITERDVEEAVRWARQHPQD